MIVNLHSTALLRPLALVACWLFAGSCAFAGETSHANMGVDLELWTLIPFAGILLSIAVLPLAAGHWWEHNRNKAIVSALLAVPIGAYLVVRFGEAGVHNLLEKGHEYVSFIALLGSLFVITGGIYIGGSLSGTPLVNTGILAIGALIASFIGTTGASVLLIRPLLRANRSRKRVAHIVIFFIFVVSNCGGLLTPLGDPPLFLGFLKGVPFTWTLHLWKEWLLVNVILLILFNVWDQRVLATEERSRPGSQLEEVMKHEPLRIQGAHNFLFLLGIVAVIYGAGSGLGTGGKPWPLGVQEAAMIGLALLAWFTTSGRLREFNEFTWAPIIEVAVLFFGIFVTMAPALLILNAWGQGQREIAGAAFNMTQPWQYFWATGALSSFLDNAPTYLTFAATAGGMAGVPVDGLYLREFLAKGEAAQALLAAISCGAVFMGANTYIGNGPNFMVKAIAEQSGVKMPGFFGYMLFSIGILLPIFGVVTFVFFR
jgi:Na+/H+ antiporter NhaD/arsenite permease-like protein